VYTFGILIFLLSSILLISNSFYPILSFEEISAMKSVLSLLATRQ
jgi:hypothetical protein